MFKRNIARFSTFLLVISVVALSVSYAQRLTGKITGTIFDTEGEGIPGVNVEISSPSLMGGVHTQISSENGTYRFVNLPPGTYEIVFSLEGFQTITRKNLRVMAGGTVTEDIILQQTTLEESVTVTARPPVVDVAKSELSMTYGKEELENIPTGRFSHYDVVKMAPGIQMASGYGEVSDRNLAFGSNMESNAYWIDGVDISNPEMGNGWHYVSLEAFEEVEATGIGSPAEYGLFTGAVVNIVTKSGGNTLEGRVSYYGQFQSLTGDNNPKNKIDWKTISPEDAYSFHRDKFYYLTFTLGGPIAKDKVWFFANFEKREDSASFWLSDPKYPTNVVVDNLFFKLSSQISQKHKLISSFFYEYIEIPDIQNPWHEKEALSSQIGHLPTWNLLYTWLISPHSYFELKYAGYWGDNDGIPLYSDFDTPPRYDGYTGIFSHGCWWIWLYETSRHQANAHFSYYAEDFLGGDHDFKVGIQYNRATVEVCGGYPGGRSYYDYDGYPYLMFEQDAFYYGGQVDALGAFIDDSWRIGERLTLNLGLRYDRSNGKIPGFPVMEGWNRTNKKTAAINDLIIWNSLSPRIGIAFQLTSDKKTLLKLSYGRYYDALHIANFEWPGPNVTDWKMYFWDLNRGDWVLWDLIPGGMDYSIDPGLRNPYADQFSVGLDRELLPDFSLGATLIYKKEKNLLGWKDLGATYEQIQMASPDNGQIYTVWNQTSDLASNQYIITNPEGYEQSYRALIFTLTKRYSHHWMLHTSLTWSKNDGLNMVAHSQWQQAMIWFAGDYGKDPNDLINAKGLLQNDRTWMLKIQAAYTFPWDILASVNWIVQTGSPIPIFVRVFGLNQDAGSGQKILAEPRNDGNRMGTWNRLDFRVQKTFQIYRSFRLSAIFDVFNLFNSDRIIGYASYNSWAGNYLEPNNILFPRRLQIGIRLEF